MANETKVIIGGMDKQSSPESISPNDYLDGHNIRNVGTEQNEGNYTTNLEGTNVVNSLLPMGQNKGVGGARFENIGKSYRVIYNSNNRHQIVEFDYNKSREEIVFENITDSGGIDIFKVTPDSYFCDIKLVDDRYLILNDSVNPLYTIDVQMFKRERNVQKTLDDLLLIKKPSLVPPKFTYESDNGRTSNDLRGSLFQFRSQFTYKDYRSSVWSTVSKRVVPENEPADGYGQNVQTYNCLKVRIRLGDSTVDTLKVGVRLGDSNWLLVKERKIKDIWNLPNLDVSIPSVKEAYNPSTNEYIFLFYNDGMYPILDQVEVNSNYDYVPDQAEAVEVINGNMLAVGGVTEGYDRPVVDGVNFTVSAYNPNIINTVENNTNLFVSTVGNKEYIDLGNGYRTLSTIFLSGTPKAGDTITIKLAYRGKSIIVQTYEMTLTSTEEAGGIISVYQFMASKLPRSSANNERVNFYTTDWIAHRNRDQQLEVRSVNIVQKSIGTITTKSVGAMKTSSSYQLALAHVDAYGKYFPIVTDDRFIIKTQSFAEAQGLLSQVTWELPEKAPTGAVSYQWLITENQTHQKWIYLTGTYDANSSDSTVLSFNMKSLARFFKNEKESQVSYSFTKGDKVTLYMMTDGNTTTPIKQFRFPFIDLDIVDFKIDINETDPTDVKYSLKVRNTDLINLSEITGKEILMELYTPKKRALTTDSLFFYEIGEQFPIVNGKYGVTTGTIREVDNYVRGRLYESTITTNTPLGYIIEDPNFSDNYTSNFYSFGRARTYNDELGKVHRKASIRYSDEYRIGSRFNGINRFFAERIYGENGGESTSKNGLINKLVMRDNSLVCIQTSKVGTIPVYKSILFDNADRQLIADTGKIFGSIQYRVGNYGCGDAKESIAVSRNLVIYMVDDHNCVPLRDSMSGLDPIDVGMSHYFIEHINNSKNLGSKLIGYFDDFYSEYNLTMQDKRGVLTNLKFEDATYVDNFPINLNLVTGLTAENGTVTLDTATGVMTYKGDLDFVGTDTISFDYFGKHIEEKVLVKEGSNLPDPFFFETLTNEPMNTYLESNEIVVSGINVPASISIVNGEYRVNGGDWTDEDGVVNNGDTITLLVLSANNPNESVTASLNIGGREGTFTVVTSDSSVEGYMLITYFITQPDPQTGSNNKYGVKVMLSHELLSPFNTSFHLVYPRYGSETISPVNSLTVTTGNLEASTGFFVIDADPVEIRVFGEVDSSSLTDGQIVMCADGVERRVSTQSIFNMWE